MMSTITNIIILFVTAKCYYQSGNHFQFNQAKRFCPDLCNSDLASIHSDEDFELVDLTILSQPNELWQSDTSPYIGLKQTGTQTNIYEWNYGSSFDYGTDISGGVLPWDDGHPTGDNKCVLQKTDPSEWFDRTCTIERTFICNECNGILNKYAVIEGGNDYATAQAQCQTRYNTNLASIHTERDYDEAQTLCDIFKKISCWIGLSDIVTGGDYVWEDGTEFDFFENGDITVSGGNCVRLSEPTFSLESVSCGDTSNYALCNLPSELMLNEFSQDYSLIDNKQWFNGDEAVTIDYMYSIDFQGIDNAKSGIAIYNSVNLPLCQYYCIGIVPDDSLDPPYRVDIRYVNVSNELSVNILASGGLQSEYIESDFYLLSVEVTNGNMFNVSINDEPILEFYDTMNDNLLNNSFSGYIGLFSDDNIITASQYLFVSGTPLLTTVAPPCPTAAPTFDPTSDPTSDPTTNPTDSSDDSDETIRIPAE